MKSLILVLSVILILGCSRENSAPRRTLPLSLSTNNRLYVVATDFQSTGIIQEILVTEETGVRGKFPVHSDAWVRKGPSNSLYAINSYGQDNIQRVNRDLKQAYPQCSVGKGTTPQDVVWLEGEQVYVSRFEKTAELMRVDALTCEKKATIDLAAYADQDGVPEMSRMLKHNGKVYVMMQRLDSKDVYKRPADVGAIAVVDPSTNRIDGKRDMRWRNPVTDFKKDDKGNWYIGEAGLIGKFSQLDGGIEKFNDDFSLSGAVVTEQTLGGDVVDFEIVSNTLGVAIVASPNSKLVAFNPSTGTLIKVLKNQSDYSLVQVLLDRDRNLFYVADRSPNNSGIKVWDAVTLQERPEHGWTLALPPFWMELAL